MKNETLVRAIGALDEDLIVRAETHSIELRPIMYRRKRTILLVAALIAALALVGFTVATIFSRFFENLPYHDVVVQYKGTQAYVDFLNNLASGDLGELLIERNGMEVIYKYFKGDTINMEFYGENDPNAGFMVIPIYNSEPPDIMSLDYTSSDKFPETYREQGEFSFVLEGLNYELKEVLELHGRLFALIYNTKDGEEITVQKSYGRYQDSREEISYHTEEMKINKHDFLFVETKDSLGSTLDIYCYLGDDKPIQAIQITGATTKEQLVDIASHLVLYNELANNAVALKNETTDIFSGHPDPVIRENADMILAATKNIQTNGENNSPVWSQNGRRVLLSADIYASYDVRIEYTTQAWKETAPLYHIPNPPLASFGWEADRGVNEGITIEYKDGALKSITLLCSNTSEFGWNMLYIYPLDQYRPLSQLDATLITCIAASVEIPDDLIQKDGYYYMTKEQEDSLLCIYTAIFEGDVPWGYKYITSNNY